MITNELKVAVLKNENLEYNQEPPFNPGIKYPEYPFNEVCERNMPYDSIRKILFLLEMDKRNYNEKSWNPLSEIISSEDSVLIKPNLARHYNSTGGTDELVTHGSIIRAILDYVYIALNGRGKIKIGDAPVQDTDFIKLIKIVGIDKIIDFYNKNTELEIEIVDFRIEKGCKGRLGNIEREELKGDPLGYAAIDLNINSELFEISKYYKKFRVTNYHKSDMIKHHNVKRNEYLISNSVLNADVIINLPKLKTHRKAGITCALKNMIGINGSKNWLPHHRVGSIEMGGDEYLYRSIRKEILTKMNEKMDNISWKYLSSLMKILHILITKTASIFPFKDQYFEGSWYGNDTIPRTITDINKIIFFADKNGVLKDEIQRKMIIIVDAIIAGESEGPLEPSPKKCGLLVGGYNPAAVDIICSTIMGFDYKKIPTIGSALRSKKYKLFNHNISDIKILSNRRYIFDDVYEEFNCNFIPTNDWKGHIEYIKMDRKRKF
jgi:uncharacterized protein (DUF362 family)